MILTQVIKLRDKWGEFQSYYVHREHSYHEQTHVAHSHMLVCPACRDQWAELKFVQDRLVFPRAQFCEGCRLNIHDLNETDRGWYPVPGSLFVEEGWGVIDDSLLRVLPDELVQREFRLHMEHIGDKHGLG